MGNPHRDRSRNKRDNFNSMGDAFERHGKLDVLVTDRHRDARPPRPKLEFREVQVFENRDCRCRITSAQGHHGTIYNFTVERIGRDRPSRFFRDHDVAVLTELIDQAANWIDGQKKSDG